MPCLSLHDGAYNRLKVDWAFGHAERGRYSVINKQKRPDIPQVPALVQGDQQGGLQSLVSKCFSGFLTRMGML